MGIYVGIDPGKSGFSAEIGTDGAFIRADQQPLIGAAKGDTFDLCEMRRRILRWKEDGVILVALEELNPMGAAKGSMATWNQALGYMAWKASLAALDVRCVTRKKNNLKKSLGIQTPARIPKEDPLPLRASKADKKAWAKRDRQRLERYRKLAKAESIRVAMSYFPNVDFKRTPRCKTPDDNKAEAALYAMLAAKMDPARVAV